MGITEEFSEIGSEHSSMTDLIEICMNDVDITNPARICSMHDLMADSAEISDKDRRTTISHARRTGLTCKEDQALPRRGPSSGTCSWLPLRGAHKIGVIRAVAGQRKRSCVQDTGKQVMRRRSSVEGVDTTQVGQERQNKQSWRRRRRLIRDP
ncbi:uncharacterized protein UHOD_11562 [Ustilago sp. UG-2017b]|nr:uncharacterized protein UHOD_11562 [Ustilago sp. UG-2017b]